MARTETPDALAQAAAEQPQAHTELFLGLVAPIGTDLDVVVREIDRELRRYSYSSSEIRLSSFLSRISWPRARDFDSLPYDDRTWQAMDAGNDLRHAWKQDGGHPHDDALALLSIGAVETERANAAVSAGHDVSEEGPATLDRRSWIFRSLKTADEVRTLRDVYGPRFFLIGAHCPDPIRVKNLRAKIQKTRRAEPEREWKHAPSQLIDRDWKEERAGGQNVRGTFHQADFFIDARDRETVVSDVSRMLNIVFGNPYTTPTADERAMFAAAGAARESAELGRQVGAAIVFDRSLISVGTNEVPRYGGGPYYEGDPRDRREFRLGRDTNRVRQEEIAEGIEDLISDRLAGAAKTAKLKTDTSKFAKLQGELLAGLPQAILDTTEVGDLTEFGRATHAEMSALLNAARRGISVENAQLFSTTFPCHNCARHVVESGITRLVYIEPYAKSRALDLHQDSIGLAGTADVEDKVLFEPFVGVAPRRFLELFDAEWRERRGYPRRKETAGWTTDFDALRRDALPVFADLENEDIRPIRPVYRLREQRVLRLLQVLFDRTKLRLEEET